MVFDGFVIYHLIKELNPLLEKARLEKITQTHEMSFVFAFYLKGSRQYLAIDLSSHHFGFHLTERKVDHSESSQFLITLKKHLEGAILSNIKQQNTDRVIIFDFIVNDFIDGQIHKSLVFEAMGKHSNLLLVQDGTIIDTFKKMFFTEGRQLLPQAKFEFFPTDKKPFTELIYDHVFSASDLVNQYMGISPLLANYLIETRINLLEINPKPTRNITDRKDYVFDLFDSDKEKMYFTSISEMMDTDEIKRTQSQSSQEQFIKKQKKKYLKQKNQYEETIEQAKKQLDAKVNGDMIYQSGLDMSSSVSSLTVGETTINLDPTMTLNENAQHFFKIYQKAKRTIEHTNRLLDESEEHLRFFETLETYYALSEQDSLKDLEEDLIPYGYLSKTVKRGSKKQQKKPNIIKISGTKSTIYIGKNSLQNAYITHELANKDDYWFHVKDFPGAHLVVVADQLDEPLLRKAAMLAAYFSSMKYSSSIPVDYTFVKYVKKISGKPGYQVTYKNHQTIYIDIDEEKINQYLKNV